MAIAEEDRKKNPAPFTDVILEEIRSLMDKYHIDGQVLDPFAGSGKLFQLDTADRVIWCMEIEDGWVRDDSVVDDRYLICNSLHVMSDLDTHQTWNAVVTSPTYGNRFADKHNAKDGSTRISYTHRLGRALHAYNSGQLQWGKRYKNFHEIAWRGVFNALKPGGWFLLNVSDHYRNWMLQGVPAWHLQTCMRAGFHLIETRKVETPRMKMGENAGLRDDYEYVYLLRKPE